MAIFYPRKQTVIIFLVCAVAVIGVGYYVKSTTPADQTAMNEDVLANAVTAKLTAPIADSGDWKKQFLDTTQPNNFKTAGSQKAAAATDEKLTATEMLGREFLTKYADMKQAGLTTDDQTVSDVSTQLANDAIARVPAPKSYTLKNLNIVSTGNAAALESYNQKLNTIMSYALPDHEHNEAVLAETALTADDMSLLRNIDPVIANYRSAIKALLAMNVPQQLAPYHLALMNGLNIALYNADSLRNIDSDPVKGMTAISLEITGLQTISDALSGIKQQFVNAGVPFNS